MFNLIYTAWPSITENKLNIFISVLSDSNRKLWFMDKLSLLPDLYSSTWIHCQIVITQSFHCAQDDRYHHMPWQQRKICCLYKRWYSWNLPLSRDYWSSNNIDHFRSSLSSFQPFIFHQQWYRNSPASYCRYPHKTEEYLWILWNNWTQSWCLHFPWSKIPPTKS